MSSAKFHLPDTQTHLLHSDAIGQQFKISVMQPLQAYGSADRYPVLYLTEANGMFDAARAIALGLQVSGQVRRFILVGIGYPGDNPFASAVLRGRDLSPPGYPEIPNISTTSIIEGVSGIEPGQPRLHGGPAFLSFIRDEIVPFIERRFPTVPEDRAYFGHSLGGTLGLHALLNYPGLFQRFILSSSGLGWDDDAHGLRAVQDFLKKGQGLDATVFMSVADQEEFEPYLDQSRLVSNYYRLAAVLRSARLPGLRLTCATISGETHVSVGAVAFSRGIRSIYGSEPSILGTPSWAKGDAR